MANVMLGLIHGGSFGMSPDVPAFKVRGFTNNYKS